MTCRYKDAVEALRRKQDKEREAAGLAPVQRLGRAAAPQRGQRGGGPNRGGGRGAPSPARGGGGPVRTGPAGGARTFHTADKNLYVHLLNHLKKKELLPVVVFTFSKKRCEEYAGTLTNFDLCTSGEKSEVHVLIERALGRLKPEDRALPQIARMRDLLGRGIGVHHGGLLPLVKEVVEILFARGLVKILFATETFAMVSAPSIIPSLRRRSPVLRGSTCLLDALCSRISVSTTAVISATSCPGSTHKCLGVPVVVASIPPVWSSLSPGMSFQMYEPLVAKSLETDERWDRP